MQGGNDQSLTIPPSSVGPDGRFTTNRNLQATQAGGFGVTATVMLPDL